MHKQIGCLQQLGAILETLHLSWFYDYLVVVMPALNGRQHCLRHNNHQGCSISRKPAFDALMLPFSIYKTIGRRLKLQSRHSRQKSSILVSKSFKKIFCPLIEFGFYARKSNFNLKIEICEFVRFHKKFNFWTLKIGRFAPVCSYKYEFSRNLWYFVYN